MRIMTLLILQDLSYIHLMSPLDGFVAYSNIHRRYSIWYCRTPVLENGEGRGREQLVVQCVGAQRAAPPGAPRPSGGPRWWLVGRPQGVNSCLLLANYRNPGTLHLYQGSTTHVVAKWLSVLRGTLIYCTLIFSHYNLKHKSLSLSFLKFDDGGTSSTIPRLELVIWSINFKPVVSIRSTSSCQVYLACHYRF